MDEQSEGNIIIQGKRMAGFLQQEQVES